VTDREELHLLSGAYALNALDGDEKGRFEAYLLTSEEARAEVASLSDTAVMIGLSTNSVAPPADLKARLMAQIAVTPQLAPLPAVRPLLTAVPPVSTGTTSSRETSQEMKSQQDAAATAIRTASLGTSSRAMTKAASHWYTRPASILVAAAAAVALFVGGNVLGLSAANESQQQAAATPSGRRRMSPAAARPRSSGPSASGSPLWLSISFRSSPIAKPTNSGISIRRPGRLRPEHSTLRLPVRR
jgi:hypothetical protein